MDTTLHYLKVWGRPALTGAIIRQIIIHLFFSYLDAGLLIAQVQVGLDIEGSATDDLAGTSVDISEYGLRVAVGMPSIEATATGKVAVYSWSGSSWDQLGSDISGEDAGDKFGTSVALSSDGSRVVIGAPNNTGSAALSGHVRVYDWDGSSWNQIGQDIDGSSSSTLAGTSVDITALGDTIIFGEPGRSLYTGRARAYHWVDPVWTQLGGNLDGDGSFDQFGCSVSISPDGSRIVVSAKERAFLKGYVRVYEWNDGLSYYQLLGNTILSPDFGGFFGHSVSMSSSGDRIAIGAYTRDQVQVYELNALMTSWDQLGGNIDGFGEFGYDVELSNDGTRLVVGASGFSSGEVKVFDFGGSAWNQTGIDIESESAGDGNGTSVALNGNGNALLVGSPFNDNGAIDAGHARVFSIDESPLPVELIAFEGFDRRGQVLLTWSTASELNNEGFQIERSPNAEAWHEVDFVAGHGTTNEIQYYQFTDHSPLFGDNYYRLKQIDYDGQFEYSPVIHVQTAPTQEVVLYPNPASSHFNVDGADYLQLYDLSGDLKLSTSTSNDVSIDASNFSPGVYMARATTPDGIIIEKKVIIIK